MQEDREDQEQRSGFKLSPAWIALGISVVTLFYQVGVTSARIGESERRVELLEAADRQRGDALGRIDARTARIEATLDIMRGGTHALSEPLPSAEETRP